MIVRERPDAFVLIEQDHHATISGELIKHWQESLFPGGGHRHSVEYAIINHDYGWKMIDKHPFWNDQENAPYSFLNFPTLPKLVFYKHGIDMAAHKDAYAGLLCSRHYTRFLANSTYPEAKEFVEKEETRQQQIIESLEAFDRQLYNAHYGLLQLCDDVSLYICMNEPGATKKDEHPFFRDGIQVSLAMDLVHADKLDLRWTDQSSVSINPFPLKSSITITLPYRVLNKESIINQGLISTYENKPLQHMAINLITK